MHCLRSGGRACIRLQDSIHSPSSFLGVGIENFEEGIENSRERERDSSLFSIYLLSYYIVKFST